MGTNVEVVEIGSYHAQFIAAEKDNEGMELKICMGANPFLKALFITGKKILAQARATLRKRVQRFKMNGHVKRN